MHRGLNSLIVTFTWAVFAVQFVLCGPCLGTSAIPGAKGFGVITQAGRGGAILKVDNLMDDGPGSLRAALAVEGPRTVVFEVAGELKLLKNLVIDKPFITVAGQTAPEPGILITGHGIIVDTHDVLIQHVRIRPGRNSLLDDCVSMNSANSFNIVLDHITAQGAPDEQISIWGGASNVTIMNSLISNGVGEKHGILIGDNTKNIFIINNVISGFQERSVMAKGNTMFVFQNNVVYGNENYEFFPIKADSQSASNYVYAVISGNIFIDAPLTNSYAAIGLSGGIGKKSQLYIYNNMRIPIGELIFSNGVPVLPWGPLVVHGFGALSMNKELLETVLLKKSGARPRFRDSIEKKVITGIIKREINIEEIELFSKKDYEIISKRFFVEIQNPRRDEDRNEYSSLEDLLNKMALDVEGDNL